jgi:amino acid adenylation domain-containing protein
MLTFRKGIAMSSSIPLTSQEATVQKKEAFVFPASFAQRRLWFLHQLDPNNSVYNIPAPMRITSPLDVEALRRSLQEIVRRHETLRTTFSAVDGEPVQVVALSSDFNLEILDLRSVPEAERETEAQRLAQVEGQRPFSLTHGPLLRGKLLCLGGKGYVLLLTMHHIISDGWSMNVLLGELSALYSAFSTGKPSPLPELTVQYGDFAQWQRELLQGEAFEQQLTYWKTQLTGAPETLDLPTDRPRPAFQSYRGGMYATALEPWLYEAIKSLGHREGMTPFMTFLAAFKVLLHRYTGNTDIVVGTPIANRSRPKVENLIGLFVNTLVLRTDLSGDPTFLQLLGRIREVALGAFTHQDMPFERLVEELQPARNLSHNPVFQVMFSLQSAEKHSLQQLPAAGSEPINVTSVTAKFDLTLSIVETNHTGIPSFEYNIDLFAPATIARLADHYNILLQRIVSHPNRRLSDLPIMSDQQRNQMLFDWNQTATARMPGRFIHHMISEQARRTPEAIALIAESSQLTYGELMARSNRMAAYLRMIGVEPHSLVGVCMERSPEMMVALLGILKAGGAYIPLDPEYPRERLALMLEDAAPSVLLTQERLMNLLPDRSAHVVCIDLNWDEIALQSDQDPAFATAPDQPAYVIYTSGSTGRPKGAMNTHAGIANRLLWMQEVFQLNAPDRVLQKTPTSFDVSVWELFWPLMAGAALVMARPGGQADLDYLIQLITETNITTLHFVPSMLRALLEHREVRRCASLKLVIASGEALTADLETWFYARLGATLYNLYGPTEASVDVTAWACPQNGSGGNIPIGRPIANTQIYLLDARMQPVPIGVPGELYIGGVGVGLGYLRRPELTAERFIPDPFSDAPSSRLYRTGDRACYRPDGNIEFLGRFDDQVKIRGFRIELEEIKAALQNHSGVGEAVVIAREYDAGDKRLIAYIVPDEAEQPRRADKKMNADGEEPHNFDLMESELRHHLARLLPDYMVPSDFVLLDTLPLLPNGKLDRRALPLPNGSRSGLRELDYVAPRNQIEQQMTHLFCELLKREQIGVYDNFFESGGHSLLATRALARIYDAYLVTLPLRRFFDTPTVAGLSVAIAEAQQELEVPAITAIPRPDHKSISALDVDRLSDSEVTALLEILMSEGKQVL